MVLTYLLHFFFFFFALGGLNPKKLGTYSDFDTLFFLTYNLQPKNVTGVRDSKNSYKRRTKFSI